MALEAFGYIKDLVPTNPTGTDPKSEGDDHIRGVKETLQTQFPNFTEGVAVTMSESQLNSLFNGRAGVMFDFAGNAAPVGSLSCDGQELDQATYPELYLAIGDLWSTTGGASAPAAGNFRLPPQEIGGFGLYTRGESEQVGVYQADELKSHVHSGGVVGATHRPDGTYAGGASGNTGATGGTETRPRSITVLKCIWTGQ